MSDGSTTTRTEDEPSATGDGTDEGASTGERLRRHLGGLPGPLIGLVILVVVFSLMSPFFMTFRNISNIMSQSAVIGVMAVGAALVIIIGGIDLSVGATLALSLMVNAWLYADHGLPFALTILIGLGVGALVGLVNGVLATYGRIQSFIATLATMSAASGLALYVTNGNPITGFPDWFLVLTSTDVLGVPLEALILVAVFGIAAFWLRYRPYGRALYAIGGSEEVARLAGIPVRRLQITVYVIAGFLAALAGLLIGSRLNSAQPTAGTADLLNVIAVVVIGGASLAGGTGSMFGTFVGLLIVGVLDNGMNLLNVSPNLQPVVIGVVIVAAVMSDRSSSGDEA